MLVMDEVLTRLLQDIATHGQMEGLSLAHGIVAVLEQGDQFGVQRRVKGLDGFAGEFEIAFHEAVQAEDLEDFPALPLQPTELQVAALRPRLLEDGQEQALLR
jgi:hypothetical protein